MLLNISPAATEKIKLLMSQRSVYPKGLRISLRTRGCSGLSWNLDFVDEVSSFDEYVHIEEGLDVYVDPKAVLFILGSTIDYMKTDLEEGFFFNNPNEKSKCGCGESFSV